MNTGIKTMVSKPRTLKAHAMIKISVPKEVSAHHREVPGPICPGRFIATA